MELTQDQIEEFAIKIEHSLLNTPKTPFKFDRNWSSNFANNAGVYAVFDKNVLVYVGETANLKKRMQEVKRTYNHSFRKKLGRDRYPNTIITKGKFLPQIEQELDEYYLENISFTFKEINFGRLEIESLLIHRNFKNGLLNSPGKRNKL